MAQYVELNGVKSWFEEQGAGDPLVMLHPGGGGVDSRALTANVGTLAEHFRILTPERRGHGHTPDVDGPSSFEVMAQDTATFLETVLDGPTHLFGVSDGAIVALLTALKRPDLIRRLVLVAGVFHWEGWMPGVIDPNNEPPGFLAQLYAEVSPDGPEHYPVIVAKLADMHQLEPALEASELGEISSRTLVMLGDDDEVRLEHAISMYRAISDSELAVIPGTSHGLLVEKPALCNQLILDFLTTDPVPTMAPIRRSQ